MVGDFSRREAEEFFRHLLTQAGKASLADLNGPQWSETWGRVFAVCGGNARTLAAAAASWPGELDSRVFFLLSFSFSCALDFFPVDKPDPFENNYNQG